MSSKCIFKVNNQSEEFTNEQSNLELKRGIHQNLRRKIFCIETMNAHQELKKVSGTWTLDEHKRFLEALKKYGNSWKKIEAYVKTRSKVQIRSHCQKYFENKRVEAIEAGKKDIDVPLFAVYYTYRNITYKSGKSMKIDSDFDARIVKKDTNLIEGDYRKDKEISDFKSLKDFKDNGIFNEGKIPLSLYGLIEPDDEQSDSLFIQESNFPKYDAMINEGFEPSNIDIKVEANYQDDYLDCFSPRKILRIKYDI